MSTKHEYEPNPAFDILAGKAWRGAREIADKPGILPEAQAYMREPIRHASSHHRHDTSPGWSR